MFPATTDTGTRLRVMSAFILVSLFAFVSVFAVEMQASAAAAKAAQQPPTVYYACPKKDGTLQLVKSATSKCKRTMVSWNGGGTSVQMGTATATLKKAQTSVTVSDSAVSASSIILLTPQGDPGGYLWVTGVAAGKFTININTAPASDLVIAYAIVG